MPIAITGKFVTGCLFFSPDILLLFGRFLRRLFTEELPVPITPVSSVQPYPYPKRLRALCRIFTPVPEPPIFVLSVGYTQNDTRAIHSGDYPTKNFCNSYRTLVPVPGTSEGSVRWCNKDPGKGCTGCLYLPGTSGSSLRLCHNTRTFCGYCKTFIPLSGTSGNSVRLSYPYPEFP